MRTADGHSESRDRRCLPSSNSLGNFVREDCADLYADSHSEQKDRASCRDAAIAHPIIVIAVAPSIPWLASGPAGWELAAQCVAEATTGLAIGMVLALPFWTASFVGELIDNLRGETLAASIDPASGEQAAILAPFSSLMFANVFLQKGGLTVLVRFFVDSFVAVPPGSVAQLNYVGIAKLLNRTMEVALSLVAPVILALLLTDTVLAFLSRFCKQLNVFSLSLTLKSVAAYGVLYFYFSSEIPYRLYDMVHDYSLRTVFN